MKEPIRTAACGGTTGATVSVFYLLPLHGISGTPRSFTFPVHATLFFTTYETTKKLLNSKYVPQSVQYAVAAALGEFTASVVSYPITSVLTLRLFVKSQADKQKFGTSPFQVAGHILRQEGLAGMYKGFSSNLVSLMSSAIVLFPTYEFLKSRLKPGQTGLYDHLPKLIEREMKNMFIQGFCFGAMAGAISGALLTPIANAEHVVDTHLWNKRFIGGKAEVKMLWESLLISAQGDVRSLYHGVARRTLVVTLFSTLLFSIYETCQFNFPSSDSS